jgi:hypothetical protein
MKNPFSKILAVFIFLCLTISYTWAQNNGVISLEKAKRSLQQEREKIFIQALHLSLTQATVFHPIFVDFSKEKRVLDDQLLSLFVKYGDNYQHLDLKLMSEFIKQSEAYQQKELKVRKKYYNKLRKAISTDLASQFYEVDDFVSTNLRLSVLAGLPFTNSITKLMAE